MTRVYIFKRFERFWHWAQAALIILMLVTGFEIHGTYALFGWEKAGNLHTTAAWTLIGLWVFAIFWHFTTGEWKQYIPTTRNVAAVIAYYSTGIFSGAAHPFRVTRSSKHNPLQRVAYLMVKLLINPLLWASGLLYLYYNDLGASKIAGIAALKLGTIAPVHAAAAFMMLAFLIGHAYLVTTGHTPLAQIKAMITGWETLDEPQRESPIDEGSAPEIGVSAASVATRTAEAPHPIAAIQAQGAIP